MKFEISDEVFRLTAIFMIGALCYDYLKHVYTEQE